MEKKIEAMVNCRKKQNLVQEMKRSKGHPALAVTSIYILVIM